jgi:2-oxoglutarate dehydrogenase E1 component
VLGEIEALDATAVRRVVLCSGKVYYDLARVRAEKKITDVAILRVEQLYPFPADDLARELATYPNATEIVWAQEEPRNQGAWHWIQQPLQEVLRSGQVLAVASRPPSASPAAGYLDVHAAQQQALVNEALQRAGG